MHAMKKTMVAAAAALAAMSAGAAQVSIYGLVDYGLMYTGLDNGVKTTDTTELTAGKYFGSRFGFKGSEDLATAPRWALFSKTAFRPIRGLCLPTAKSLIANRRCISKAISATSSSAA